MCPQSVLGEQVSCVAKQVSRLERFFVSRDVQKGRSSLALEGRWYINARFYLSRIFHRVIYLLPQGQGAGPQDSYFTLAFQLQWTPGINITLIMIRVAMCIVITHERDGNSKPQNFLFCYTGCVNELTCMTTSHSNFTLNEFWRSIDLQQTSRLAHQTSSPSKIPRLLYFL